MNVNPTLNNYLQEVTSSFDTIATDRKAKLELLSQYIQTQIAAAKATPIIVICTHNSRRSHFGQAWLQLAAHYYGISAITTYSGGTEATRFNENAIAALQRAGVVITEKSAGDNPVYEARFAEELPSLEMFSKAYFDEFNPQRDFAAIMVCTDADEGCPVVLGAAARFSLPFEDPKAFDNTPLVHEKYDERCFQIAVEMFYALSRVKTA